MSVSEAHGLRLEDGLKIFANVEKTVDVVIVGSGPAGAAVARELARAGLEVVVIEAGEHFQPKDFPEDGFTAMSTFYRNLGGHVSTGNTAMPLLQGKAVGGTSICNGAISWRLPQDIHERWIAEDPALEETISWGELSEALDVVERDLKIAPTENAVAGPKNLLMAKGAEALGLEHRPTSRNVDGCVGLGRCMQGCPEGHKMSVDRGLLPEACELGTLIYSSVRARTILMERGTAVGIEGWSKGGGKVQIRARKAVVLAASAIQTPILLIKNGLRRGPVGYGFQGHPGVSMSGRFPEAIRMWKGATQGHEVIGLRKEGIKFEALGYDLSILGSRLGGVGKDFVSSLKDIAHWCNWGAAIHSSAKGRVKPGLFGPSVSFSLTQEDVTRIRRAVQVMGEMMLEAGADYVEPGVAGWHNKVTDRDVMRRFQKDGPWNPGAYSMVITHMFGTCKMGSDPRHSVVRTDFRHHDVQRLYVADSSVFPSNTGVNPQTSIIAMAILCAKQLLKHSR